MTSKTDDNRDRALATRIATGAAAGVIAGLAASFVMHRFQALTQPSSAQNGEPATQQAAGIVARFITGAPLPETAKPVGGQLVHYGLGVGLGAGYAVAAEFVPQVTVFGGMSLAIASWTMLDEVGVPAAGLGDPPWKSPPSVQAYGFLSHVVFGLAVEMTRRLVRRTIIVG